MEVPYKEYGSTIEAVRGCVGSARELGKREIMFKKNGEFGLVFYDGEQSHHFDGEKYIPMMSRIRILARMPLSRNVPSSGGRISDSSLGEWVVSSRFVDGKEEMILESV